MTEYGSSTFSHSVNITINSKIILRSILTVMNCILIITLILKTVNINRHKIRGISNIHVETNLHMLKNSP
jgi:hypothetical protein